MPRRAVAESSHSEHHASPTSARTRPQAVNRQLCLPFPPRGRLTSRGVDPLGLEPTRIPCSPTATRVILPRNMAGDIKVNSMPRKRRRAGRSRRCSKDERCTPRGEPGDLRRRICHTDLRHQLPRAASALASPVGRIANSPEPNEPRLPSPELKKRLLDLAHAGTRDQPSEAACSGPSTRGRFPSGCSASSEEMFVLPGGCEGLRSPCKSLRCRQPSASLEHAAPFPSSRLTDAASPNNPTEATPQTPFGYESPVIKEDPSSGDEADPQFGMGNFDPANRPVRWINRFHVHIRDKGIRSPRRRFQVMRMYLPTDVHKRATKHFTPWWTQRPVQSPALLVGPHLRQQLAVPSSASVPAPQVLHRPPVTHRGCIPCLS